MNDHGAVSLAIDGDVAIVTLSNPPVNGISAALRSGLVCCLATAVADSRVAALVLVCEGRCFLSGLDVREFGRQVEGPDQREMLAPLDACPKPVVVAAHGVALGGGVETMLCADYRAVQTGTELGLMEINYGLLPGAGGTQRLPRLVGAEAALEMMLSGERIDADCALAMGLVDEIFGRDIPPAVAGRAAARRWLDAGRGKRRVRDLPARPADPQGEALAGIAARAEARGRGFRVPGRIAACVRAALTLPFEEGMVVEQRAHEACEQDPQSAAMLHVFFAERRNRPAPASPAAAEDDVRRVAVVGAGTMGRGIALACLRAGLAVSLADREARLAREGAEAVAALVERDAALGRVGTAEATRRRDRLRACDGIDDLGSPNLVIEAVFEDADLKHRLFAALDAACPGARLLASNTSTLDVEAMARATARPDRVLGLHFFSPAHVMPLVEVVVPATAAAESVAAARRFVQRLGKIGVVVGNDYGFVGNRMLHAYGREAQLMLLEGAAPERIDRVLTDFGMAMGPNAVGDLAGLDVGYHARRAWTGRPDDPRFYRVADALVEAGRLGCKTGRGAYRYAPGSREPQPDPEVERLIAREAAALGVARRRHEDREIRDRCLFALVAEGIGLLERGTARCAGDIDVIWCNGYGFPRHLGGPMHWADGFGAAAVADRIRSLAAEHGERYWSVPPLLARAAARGESLASLSAPGAATASAGQPR